MESGGPTNPGSFNRRVLLALGGMSPQVITETLYCLCIRAQPSFVPTEVHLLTTTVARDETIEALLDDDGEFHAFIRDYGLEGKIAFSVDHLHALHDETGRALDDVRTGPDNLAAADFITEKVREFTADPETALHVSMAGGRNTLGFYIGYALSMFGRPQDRLSHVLVAGAFQDNDDFFYPPPEPEIIQTRRGCFSTADSQLVLADIPFVRLRHGLPQALMHGKASYSQTVAAIQKSFASPALRIEFEGRRIWCGDVLVEMPPQPFAWYAWMAERVLRAKAPDGHASWRDAGLAEEFLGVYREVVGSLAHDYEATRLALAGGMDRAYFDEKKSRVNRWLEDVLGKAQAVPYLISPSGRRPNSRYGLNLNPAQITVKRHSPPNHR